MDPSLFGTREMPLRPSSLGKLMKCPMSVLLPYFEDGGGNEGAQTGSVVHAAVEAFHNGRSVEEATAAALATFPKAVEEKARGWIAAYVADPANKSAVVTAVELQVTLEYRGVFIRGTLDQIRQTEDGVGLVWDLKTGASLAPGDCVAEYQFQQAGYVLAARETLQLPIAPGGIIYAAGYDKKLGRRHLPMGVTVADCIELMDEVVREVEYVRAGGRPYRPTADHCKYCPLAEFPKCKKLGNRLLGTR